MPEPLSAEQRADWRADAEMHLHDGCDKEPMCDDRILALLDEVDRLTEAHAKMRDAFKREHEWRREADARAERAEAALAKLRAAVEKNSHGHSNCRLCDNLTDLLGSPDV